jgi:hypothetical protein
MREAGIETELLRPIGQSSCEIVTVAGDGTHRTRYGGDAGDLPPFDAAAAIAGASLVLIDATSPVEQLRLPGVAAIEHAHMESWPERHLAPLLAQS